MHKFYDYVSESHQYMTLEEVIIMKHACEIWTCLLFEKLSIFAILLHLNIIEAFQ